MTSLDTTPLALVPSRQVRFNVLKPAWLKETGKCEFTTICMMRNEFELALTLADNNALVVRRAIRHAAATLTKKHVEKGGFSAVIRERAYRALLRDSTK